MVELRAVRGTDAGTAARVSATPRPPSPPAPTGLSASAGVGGVTLTWTDPGDATISSYAYRLRQSGGKWTVWKQITGRSIFTYWISGLTNGATYTLELRAIRGISTAGPAASTTATILHPTLFAPIGTHRRTR